MTEQRNDQQAPAPAPDAAGATPPSPPAPPVAAPQPAPGPPPPPAAAPPAPPGAAPAAAGPPPADVLRTQAQAVLSRLDPQGIRPTAAIATFLLLFFFGSQLVNSAIPVPSQPGPGPGPTLGPGPGPTFDPGPAPTIGPGPGPVQPNAVDLGPILVQLPAGWQVVEGPGGAPRMVKGSVAIDVASVAFNGDASTLYRGFVDQVLEPNASGFSATQPTPAQVGAGLPAVRGLYTGVFGEGGQIEGHLTAIVAGGQGFIFDGWGPVGTLRPLLAEIEAVTNTLVLDQ